MIILSAKIRKKIVKAYRFWRINAIRPLIMVIRRKTEKFSFRLTCLRIAVKCYVLQV